MVRISTWLRMATLCGHCGGSQSARAGGTIQAASAVSTRMMPLTACRSWPRRCMWKRDVVADARVLRQDRDRARGIVQIAAVFGYCSSVLAYLRRKSAEHRQMARAIMHNGELASAPQSVRTCRQPRTRPPCPPTPFDAATRRSIAFLNLAHGLDHFVLLIYPTVVIGLEVVYGRPYSELIALSSTAFVAFGVFSLPAGWLADRWSRRNMMAAFYFGCGVSLVGVALCAEPADAVGRHVRARHVRRDLSSGRHGDADRGLASARPHARLQRRLRQCRRVACRRHHRRARLLAQLARGVLCAGAVSASPPASSISGSRRTTATTPEAASRSRRCR